jgi:hypothetical protein
MFDAYRRTSCHHPARALNREEHAARVLRDRLCHAQLAPEARAA